MGADHRSQKRIRLNLRVHVAPLGEDHTAGPEVEGNLYDLSVGGCAFHYDHELAIGVRIQVRIELDEQLAKRFNKPILTARGVIIRSIREETGDAYLISMRFQPQNPT